jgi:hypothetical protein
VDVLTDNAIAILGVLWILVVAGAFVYAVLAALSLWRSLKAARGRLEGPLAELSAAGAAIEAGTAGLEARQRDLEEASSDLQRQANAAIVVGQRAGEVATALRDPVRFLAGL